MVTPDLGRQSRSLTQVLTRTIHSSLVRLLLKDVTQLMDLAQLHFVPAESLHQTHLILAYPVQYPAIAATELTLLALPLEKVMLSPVSPKMQA